MDPNSANQTWSAWRFTVHEGGRGISRKEVKYNAARWLRAGFGSVGEARVKRTIDGWLIEARVEGASAADPEYVASVRRQFQSRFVARGWGLMAWSEVDAEVLAGSGEDGKPPRQWIGGLPSIPLLVALLGLMLLPAPVVSAQITEADIERAARDVVMEAALVRVELERAPQWRDALHHGCIGALLYANWRDYSTTKIALDLGATEQNPFFDLSIQHAGVTGLRISKALSTTVVVGLLQWIYMGAKSPMQRHLSTAACGVLVVVTGFAVRQNVRVAEELR